MIQYYSPNIENDPILPQEESAHCIRVLRKKVGDEIFVTDGKGNLFKTKILEADQRRTKVEILEKITSPTQRNYKIRLAIAPTKNSDRIEWMLEKITEIGIDSVILLQCDHNERKTVKTERLERILISAMKQSLKTVKPELIGLTPFKEVAASDFSGIKVMGYCDSKTERKLFTRTYRPGTDVTIFIGPEGDFSPEEVEFAIKHNVIPVTFGNNRLRTETAGLYGVTSIHALNGE